MTIDARRKWEEIFNSHYITPVLENLQQVLYDAVDCITADEGQGRFDWIVSLLHEVYKTCIYVIIKWYRLTIDSLGIIMQEILELNFYNVKNDL